FSINSVLVFFFQAEDDIRYSSVTGVQTCALPIYLGSALSCVDLLVATYFGVARIDPQQPEDPLRDRCILSKGHAATALYTILVRSEERRVGKEGTCWEEQFDMRVLDRAGMPGVQV